jgi:hypothetical protein
VMRVKRRNYRTKSNLQNKNKEIEWKSVSP